ncbi:ATPase [Caminibacter pacificus]|uniref:ATP synthase subunit b n=1 Tax=Caminibacter pacificus TaxID=1424653 RepID=A0AAJ4RCM7_9BACT|nr:ATPase [Caminibacter pacificus]NPA87488.1 ATPase [Campylobacterota bacterium]QCI27893.1 ATPase [Caminibacter pacificus]ROR39929.1 F-type H+-transporting ATPase subunit b [Caminibacter pacificus]
MLDLNLGVMLIEAGIFLITMVLLKMWLFDPLVKFMDEREAKLKAELEMINKNTEETKELEEEIQTILQLARDDARRIVDEARKKATEEAERIKAVKVREIEDAKESLKLELKKQKEEILKELLKDKEEVKSLIENKIRNAA